MKIKVGFGFDVHQLKKDHPFILGGVKLDHHSGTFGHSDADVLAHAVSDAILGAANLEDIGFHFPDTDPKWKDSNSIELLKHCVKLLAENNWSIGNIDAVLCIEAPKIKPYIPEIKATLSKAMNIPLEDISIKATTNEKMGFVGREEGVAAHVVCLIQRN